LAAALKLSEHGPLQVDSLLVIIGAPETVDAELRRFAGADERCQPRRPIGSARLT
jgi:hypothetical protein